MNVLIVGSGGREHALAWKLKASPRIDKLYVAPGNGGTQFIAENIAINETDLGALSQFAREKGIDLTVVSCEEPLALGIVDHFKGRGLRIWGPSRAAAQIESSKAFAKQIMHEAHIPTAAFEVHTDVGAALGFVRRQNLPIVVKASGLARGKGVYICRTFEEAQAALEDMLVKKVFGEAGAEVVLEEFLEGEEISVHAFCDGLSIKVLPPAQDYKRALDGNQGKNTGGMGAIAPVPWVTLEMMTSIEYDVMRKMVEALAYKGTPFVGVLYAGIMIGTSGIKVLEWNARLGDPEAQALLPLIASDLLDHIEACLDGSVADMKMQWHRASAATVVLASKGYPDEVQTGFPVFGIKDAIRNDNVMVFQAGTTFDGIQTKTAGGRVLSVTGIGSPVAFALETAYKAIEKISFDGMQLRRDIGASSIQ